MSGKTKQTEVCCQNRCIGTCCAPVAKRARLTETSSVTILDVLEVVILQEAILRNLSLAELLQSERVCQRWRDAVNHYIRGAQRFRSTLHITAPWYHASPAPDSRCLLLDERDPWYARTLYKWGMSVETAPCTADSFADVCEYCPNLQALTLYGIPDQDSIRENLGKLEKLKRLVFKELCSPTRPNEQLPDDIISIFLEKDTLECLSIIGHERLTGTCFKHLKTDIATFHLQDCPVIDNQLILSALDSLTELRTLNLTRLSSEILKNCSVLLDKMPKLERLELCWYNEMEMDLQVFGRLNNLKHLNLSHNSSVSDNLLEIIADSCKLESFDVSYCEGVTLWSLLLVCGSSGRTLTKVGVASHDYLTDEDVETIIRLCPHISDLNVQFCRGVSAELVPRLQRLVRRRRRRCLPPVRLRVFGTAVPNSPSYGLMRQTLIMDFLRDAELPEVIRATMHGLGTRALFRDSRSSIDFLAPNLVKRKKEFNLKD